MSQQVTQSCLTKGGILAVVGGVGVGLFHKHRSTKLQAQTTSARGSEIQPTSSSIVREEVACESMRLKHVQVFFRHGARTPLKHIYGVEEAVYDKRFLIGSVQHTEIPYTVKDTSGGPRPHSGLQDHYRSTQFKVNYDKRFIVGILPYTEIPTVCLTPAGNQRPFSSLWAKDRSVNFKGGVFAGMLTKLGKDQVYSLGRRLAVSYPELIGKKFDRRNIVLRSTNIDRCVESAGCVVAGLFGKDSFDPNDPVVITVMPLAEEVMIPLSKYCPMYEQISTTAFRALCREPVAKQLYAKIQSFTGETSPIEEFDMMQMRDHIVARRAHGLPVPDFFEKLFTEIDRAAVATLLTHIGVNRSADGVTELANETLGISLAIGRCLNMIKETLEACTSPANQSDACPRLGLFSCHDSTLAPMLLAMGCYDNEWPPYAADIIIELYEDSQCAQMHWVKVKYCNKEMTLRGCAGPLITLEQFLSVLRPYTVDAQQYKVHCNGLGAAVKHFNKIEKERAEPKTMDVASALPPNI